MYISNFGKQLDMKFDGKTIGPGDSERLQSLLGRVFRLMADGKWRTLFEIRGACGGTEASVSARLRDFRKEKNGGYEVEHRHVGGGLWEYRLITKERP